MIQYADRSKAQKSKLKLQMSLKIIVMNIYQQLERYFFGMEYQEILIYLINYYISYFLYSEHELLFLDINIIKQGRKLITDMCLVNKPTPTNALIFIMSCITY